MGHINRDPTRQDIRYQACKYLKILSASAALKIPCKWQHWELPRWLLIKLLAAPLNLSMTERCLLSVATLTPEFTTPWTNIIRCWKPVSFPCLTKFQPCNSVLHVCSTFSRGKESSLHPHRAIYSSRCSLAEARPTESAPLTENCTPCLSGSLQDFYSCFVYKFENGAILSRISHLFFPPFPVFYNPNCGNIGENFYMLSKSKVYFSFS